MNEIIIHIDVMQDKAERLKEKVDLWGEWPLCAICGIKLQDGDQVDGHFPHMDNYNRCQKCKDVSLDSDREYEYLRSEEKEK